MSRSLYDVVTKYARSHFDEKYEKSFYACERGTLENRRDQMCRVELENMKKKKKKRNEVQNNNNEREKKITLKQIQKSACGC